MQAAQSELVTPLDAARGAASPRAAGRLRAVAYWAFTLLIALQIAPAAPRPDRAGAPGRGDGRARSAGRVPGARAAHAAEGAPAPLTLAQAGVVLHPVPERILAAAVVRREHLVHHPAGPRGALPGAGARALPAQGVADGLDERLLAAPRARGGGAPLGRGRRGPEGPGAAARAARRRRGPP